MYSDVQAVNVCQYPLHKDVENLKKKMFYCEKGV